MKLEPLPQKKQQLSKQAKNNESKKQDEAFSSGYIEGIKSSFDTFTQLIHQYKRYKDDVKLLMEEQKPLWKSWVSYYENKNNISQNDYLQQYNSWLFNYIFQECSEESTLSVLSL
jgi:hypothetical protein